MEDDKEFEDKMKLIQKAIEVCKEPNKTYEFECPICGEQARAEKSSINGHIHLRCDKCDISIMQLSSCSQVSKHSNRNEYATWENR